MAYLLNVSRTRCHAAKITALLAIALAANVGVANAHAHDRRFNNGVVANVHTTQHQAGCTTDIHVNRQL